MAPAQIKQDLNRSGWETTDFPSVCENCLPDNPYVQICTRPFTVFRWKADRTARTKRTNICLTCARLKNCCQCCMLDLSFGLPIVVRDAALKLVAPGPQSSVNREYYAQEHEQEIEEGRGGVEEYEKTDEKARDLLRRLANSEPYYRKQRRLGPPDQASGAPGGREGNRHHGPGPVRTRDSRGQAPPGGRGGPKASRGGVKGSRGMPGAGQTPPGPHDVIPPEDPTITSLFLTGVEDDLPEHELRSFFSKYGALRSVVCSHRSHCAFINYQSRAAAETAAAESQGKAVIAGCPLRVQWGKPKPLDGMDRQPRMEARREGRAAVYGGGSGSRGGPRAEQFQAAGARPPVAAEYPLQSMSSVAPPPGQDDVRYASLAGN
ncbi:MAG: Pre-mRNA-splicing factor slt11 [Lichina confinis]|nr:MAG: Pre-mRNA-splicing factor slt11 [Lichina confinis]